MPTSPLRLYRGSLDPTTRILQRPGEAPEVLGSREVALLYYLLDRPDATVSNEELLQAIWGRRWSGDPAELGVVRNTIFRLRNKIERNPGSPEHILKVQSEGYRFIPCQETPAPPPGKLPPPGALWKPDWDVGREGETQTALQNLSQPHHPLIVLGGWRWGKSWFFRRIAATFQGSSDRLLRLESRLWEQELTQDLNSFLPVLTLEIADCLGLAEGETTLPGQGPISTRFKSWLGRQLLKMDGRLILVVEDLDRLQSRPFFGDWMALLRQLVQEERRGWSQLRLCCSSTIHPAALTALLPSSAFNVGTTLELGPLDGEAVQALCTRAALALSRGEQNLLLERSHGHPYLLHLLLHEVERSGPSALSSAAQIDRALAPAVTELSARRLPWERLQRRDSGELPERELEPFFRLGLLDPKPPYRSRFPELLSRLAR